MAHIDIFNGWSVGPQSDLALRKGEEEYRKQANYLKNTKYGHFKYNFFTHYWTKIYITS